eukprot:COSAG01_NODE_58528_length_305_cov_1.237864_1_plen_41_part_00
MNSDPGFQEAGHETLEVVVVEAAAVVGTHAACRVGMCRVA